MKLSLGVLWGRRRTARVRGYGVTRQGNKQLRTKGKTESWMSLQNSPGSRKILDKRKINTMNLTERLTSVRWTEVCPGTNASHSPARSTGIVAILSLLSGPQPLHGDLPTGVGAKALLHHSKALPARKCSALQPGLSRFSREIRCDEPC